MFFQCHLLNFPILIFYGDIQFTGRYYFKQQLFKTSENKQTNNNREKHHPIVNSNSKF